MKRPIRDKLEREGTGRVPSGPLGKVGEGDIIGAGGFLAVETARTAFQFLPGIKTPGYSIVAHNAESVSDGEVHRFTITAISEDVAEFVAQYSSAPGNINFVISDVELEETDRVTTRPGYSTYNIRVRLMEG